MRVVRGINLKPSRVYQTATSLLNTLAIPQPPPWYTTIGSIPPGEMLTRTQPIQHQEARAKSRKVRKPSKLFKPQQIEYEEDQLRREFYGDHPWELARPRVVLENDGKDGQRCCWSHIDQSRHGVPLTGESVVQRQLWLINYGLEKSRAYDQARKEFYGLRHADEVERRVAREEAMWSGAYFGKGYLEIAMGLEDKTYELWKAWATTQVNTLARQRDSAYTGIGTENEEVPGEDNSVESDAV